VKASELRELTANELALKLDEAKAELFNLRFQLATNQLDSSARLRLVRRDIARIATVIREQEIEAWHQSQTEDGGRKAEAKK
jgi:large subunit ribosomal protein L29